jgi:hypothetical protein
MLDAIKINSGIVNWIELAHIKVQRWVLILLLPLLEDEVVINWLYLQPPTNSSTASFEYLEAHVDEII